MPDTINKTKEEIEPKAVVNVEGANKNMDVIGRSIYGKRIETRKGDFRKKPEKDEFDQKIVDLARVTRVMGGGKRMSFRACIAIGNKNGQVGVGIAKGADVTNAISKAVAKAKKDIVNVSMESGTVAHEVVQKLGAAKIFIKPGKKGNGIIAGGAARIVLELSGIHDVTCKIFGTNNKVNNAKCTLEALRILEKK